MTAHAHNFMEQPPQSWSDSPESQEETALIPVPRQPEDMSMSDKEVEMLRAFFNFGQKYENVNFTTERHEDSPQLAHAAHKFLRTISEGYIMQRTATTKEAEAIDTEDMSIADAAEIAEDIAAPKWFVVSMPPIERRINEYYAAFGTKRRQKSERVVEPEQKYLELHKRPIHAVYYTWGLDEFGVPERQTQPRSNRYPEIALGMQLEQTLRKNGNQTAADSVEVLLAAYGGYFLDRTGNLGHHAVNGRNHVVRITDSDIPEAMQKENYRPR